MKHHAKVKHPFKEDYLTKHHLYPLGRMKRKDSPDAGILLHSKVKLWWERHKLWHRIFGFKTIDECIDLLLTDKTVCTHMEYHHLFRTDQIGTVRILLRLKQIKICQYSPKFK